MWCMVQVKTCYTEKEPHTIATAIPAAHCDDYEDEKTYLEKNPYKNGFRQLFMYVNNSRYDVTLEVRIRALFMLEYICS